jgi:hypothetical protein
MGVKLVASSNGSVELVPTNTASNFTVTVPAATTTMVGTDATQTLTNKTSTTIGVGNATPSASGAGITFPATQSASTDANTLDDYEEGTWTPLQGSGLTVVGTYSSSGRYTKIGRSVSITAQINGSTSVACGGNGQICTGLPFTPSSGENPTSLINEVRTFSNNGSALPSGAVQNSTAISAVSGIFFSCTYFV